MGKQSKQLRYPPDIKLQHEHARFHIDFHKVSETQSPHWRADSDT